MNQTLIGEDFHLEIPRLTRPVTPEVTAPFAELFHAVDALRAPGASLVILFAGAGPRGATAAIASGFARTAERALDLPVLFVDGSGDHAGGARAAGGAPDLLAEFRAGLSPREIASPTRDPGISWTGFGRHRTLAGAEIARLVEATRESFAVVVIDAGPMTGHSLAPALARHCDGALLVSRSGGTEAASLAIARVALERAGGQVLGAVLEGDETRLPRFLATRL